MKQIPLEARTKNIVRTTKPNGDKVLTTRRAPAGHVANCEWCGDEGVLVVYMRPEGNTQQEEYGPCPFCESGYEREFNSGEWPDGFWQGRDLVPMKLYPNGTQVLPKHEQAANAKAMLERLTTGVLKDMPDG